MSNVKTSIQTIGFIGLGNMGKPMADNLLKNGFSLKVFDLNEAVLAQMAEQGATVCDSPISATTDVDMVISMLPAGQHVKSVYLGSDDSTGVFDSLDPSTLVADCSTIAAADARAVAEVAKQKGIQFVDAPVSGGTGGATAGTLTFIVGGEAKAFDQVKPVLEAMGKNIFHAGDHGAGQVAKICNNMLLGILMSGTAEAINLGVKNGLDPKVLSDIMLQSSGRNWTLEVYNPYPNVIDTVPSSKGYTGGFMSKLMLKDMNLAKTTADDTGVQTPMADQARDMYTAHVEDHADADFSSIMAVFDDSVLK
ncbi:3-hydroxyisobutyrate dehydrogenase [Psychrobacter sp. HD31]|uniref:3-hydroxyisobutyrate dehydrogenase n=1 Tax=Psychrobacter sp. HD31 TaxID=3112003 RepID=UPI003DA5818B